jgi:type II secretory pathway component PulK
MRGLLKIRAAAMLAVLLLLLLMSLSSAGSSIKNRLKARSVSCEL